MTVQIRQIFLFLLFWSCSSNVTCFADPRESVSKPAISPKTDSNSPSIHVEILGQQTCEGLGACQGAAIHDGFVYLYGDLYEKDQQSGPGIIRQYEFKKVQNSRPQLHDTGVQIKLTRSGENVINHPTGLTWHPVYGTFLGNTITKSKTATIYHLNWAQMLIDGNLDHAIMNIVADDLSVQGCRPEFVRLKNRWVLATADYGEIKNAVRFYDPDLLSVAKSTSDQEVLIDQFPCTRWVQQLHWIDSQGLLMIVQNQIEGRRWRLTPADLKSHQPPNISVISPYDAIPDSTELEGFTMLDDQFCLFVTGSREDNVTIARLKVLNPEKK